MNEQLRSFLEIEGIDIPTDDPPPGFLVADNPIISDSQEKSVDSSALYQMAGVDSEKTLPDEKYWKLRQFYINQVRASERNKLISDMTEEIRNTLKNGNIEDINSLMEERHKWTTVIHISKNDGIQTCIVPTCSHQSLPGTKYCINHITEDKDQHLYAKCEVCGTVYPVVSKCYFCHGK